MRLTACALVAVVAAAVLAGGCFSNNNLSLIPYDDGSVHTRVVLPAEGKTQDRILMLDLDGVITEHGSSFLLMQKEPTTFRVRQKLDRALADTNVKALIIRINSPGGGANASDIVYREILDYKAQAKVPVVAMMMGVAASGGVLRRLRRGPDRRPPQLGHRLDRRDRFRPRIRRAVRKDRPGVQGDQVGAHERHGQPLR